MAYRRILMELDKFQKNPDSWADVALVKVDDIFRWKV